MKVLLVDGSTSLLRVGVAEGGVLYEEFSFPTRGGSSSALSFLKESSFFLSIEGLIVGAGPGSHTGVRGSVAWMQAIAFARSLPLLSLCSLAGFVPQERGAFSILFDGKLAGLFLLTGQRTDVLHLDTPKVLTSQELFTFLQSKSGSLFTSREHSLLSFLERNRKTLPNQWKVQEVDFSLSSFLEASEMSALSSASDQVSLYL